LLRLQAVGELKPVSRHLHGTATACLNHWWHWRS